MEKKLTKLREGVILVSPEERKAVEVLYTEISGDGVRAWAVFLQKQCFHIMLNLMWSLICQLEIISLFERSESIKGIPQKLLQPRRISNRSVASRWRRRRGRVVEGRAAATRRAPARFLPSPLRSFSRCRRWYKDDRTE
nr:homologous-pairing protein 2 homolog [Ipomoea batatas]